MKQDLKTLKELGYWDEDKAENGTIKKKELRQEAIRWIKEMAEDRTTPDEIYNITRTTETWMIINWIKYFFNITEEDLKC